MQGKLKVTIKNDDGNIIINTKDKAASFNHFFSKVDENLAGVTFPDNCRNKFHHINQVSLPLSLSKSILRR